MNAEQAWEERGVPLPPAYADPDPNFHGPGYPIVLPPSPPKQWPGLPGPLPVAPPPRPVGP
jgi:hypothetical protein